MNESILIKNCRLYNSKNNNEFKNVLIEASKISQILNESEIPESVEIIEADGRILSPGFIDVHIQGAGGADVLDNTPEALETISATLAKLGTTGFLGTTVVKPIEGNSHLKLAREYTNKGLSGAEMLGVHLEGPYINMKKKGGLAPDAIYGKEKGSLDDILKATGDSLKMMTIAPELPGNLEIIKQLTANNIVASFAHSDATYEETKAGFDAGISHVTHLFNAMPSLHHRNPGPLSAIFENNNITAQLISDGHHLHPSIVNLIFKILGDRCVCITDGMHGIGLPDGKYVYNGKDYESKAGAARYLDGTLIGSTMSLGQIALKFKEFTGCSLEAAINSVSKTPAEVLGLGNRKGTIGQGKDADLVLFDNDFSIYTTVIGGHVVYKKY